MRWRRETQTTGGFIEVENQIRPLQVRCDWLYSSTKWGNSPKYLVSPFKRYRNVPGLQIRIVDSDKTKLDWNKILLQSDSGTVDTV
jgi:hypothetical protein